VRFSAVREVVTAGGSREAPAGGGTPAGGRTSGVVVLTPGCRASSRMRGGPATPRWEWRNPAPSTDGPIGRRTGSSGTRRHRRHRISVRRTGPCLPHRYGARGDRCARSLVVCRSRRRRARVDTGSPFALQAGQTLRIGFPSGGLRTYTAVRGRVGGRPDPRQPFHGHPLRSRPAPLARGQFLRVGPEPAGTPVGNPELQRELPGEAVLRFVPGRGPTGSRTAHSST
jgi:hypothetical protein